MTVAAGEGLSARGSREPGTVAVIGGGIGGLAAAHYLTEAGWRVTLFEASDRFGGLGSFFDFEGDALDRFYHVILPTDAELLALLGELEMADSVYWRETTLGFYYARELFPLNSALDLLRFRPARFVDRVRLGLTALWASYVARPGPLDDETVESWLTRLSGRRAFDKLWKPLLRAKFGDAYRQIPALWYWASFNREKGTKKEVKGYLEGGYKAITDRLVASLGDRGARLRLGTPVEELELDREGGARLRAGGVEERFDRALSTVPMVALNAMAGPALSDSLGSIEAKLDYQGVVNVVVLLERPLTDHYWIPCVDSDVPFQGIVETTRAIRLEETGGRHLVYLMNYVHRSDPLFSRDEEEVSREYLAALLDLVPGVSKEDVIATRLFTAPFVEPLYTPGYGRRKPPFELVPDAIYLATTAQVYPEVTSWNSSTGIARRAVEALIAEPSEER